MMLYKVIASRYFKKDLKNIITTLSKGNYSKKINPLE